MGTVHAEHCGKLVHRATLMRTVTADPRITGVPYSPIALRTGVDWAERRTVQV